MRWVQTVRSTHHQGSRASPAGVGVGATVVGLFSSFWFFTHPLSCAPWLHGRYPLRRYYGRSDSRRAALRALRAMNSACPRRVSLITANRLPAIPSPTIGVLTGDRPAASGFRPASTGFVFHSKTRPPTPTESSSGQQPVRAVGVTDWSFSFRCSPPRLTATQLRFDTARFFTARERTSTALSSGLLRRTPRSPFVSLRHDFFGRIRAGHLRAFV